MSDHGSAGANAALPEWDLSDLYSGPESPQLERDLSEVATAATAFETRYAGQLATLESAEFGAAIAEYERIGEIFGRVMSYAQLLYAGDVADATRGRFHQSMQERITDISTHTLFFTLEINRLDQDILDHLLTDPAAQHYAPWLRDLRLFRAHQLSDELEKMLHDLHVCGTAAWHRLFEETIARLRFPVGGQELTSAEALNLLSDRDRRKREEAGRSLGQVLADNAPLFALISNTLAKEKEIDDRWRGYPRPQSFRNLANQVEDEVVDALVAAVKANYATTAHRYYAMKARWLGLDTLQHWDRNAPLLDDQDRLYSWDEARGLVLEAYGAFSPELAALGRRFFDNAWIDVPPRPGKSPGAFAHPTVPSAHPYLLLNYMGRSRDVMTLAHELGHGVHQLLAASQGPLLSDTPLTLAETASVFGEMLTFRALLDRESDPARRRILLAGKVEDMLNTVVRQIAFYDFESRLHQERRQGELAPERIGEIWLEVQRESLGPAFDFDESYRFFWSYISHFIHSPFYVYAYAFGDCLVNSLYSTYQSGTIPDFQTRYLDLLRAGGTLRHRELLAPFGLDASDPAFWGRGLSVLTGFIDELEQAV